MDTLVAALCIWMVRLADFSTTTPTATNTNSAVSGTLQMVQMTDVATLGSNSTLICSWTPPGGESVALVKWISETFIEWNMTTCAFERTRGDTSNMVITTGYRHQTLTFVNVSKELNGSGWICQNNRNSSPPSTIVIRDRHNVTLRSRSPTAWYGSTFTFICSYDLEPGNWTSAWVLKDKVQFSLSEENCRSPNGNYKTACSKYEHVVTLTEVTSDDNGDMWQCSVAKDYSNKVRITVLQDPGWPDGVEIHTIETETPIIETTITETPITETTITETPITETTITETIITETPTTLLCSTRCEDKNYAFNWNISSGNISQTEYSSCTSTCTQKITFDVEGTYSHYTVKCTVINNRTMKEDSAVIKLNIALKPNQVPDHVTSSDHVTTQPSAVISDVKYIYIGAGSIVGVLLIVVCIVLIVCCKRKSAGSDKVMEDNVLYGYGGSESTHTGNKPVMMDNVLYTSAEEENSKSQEKIDMVDNLLYTSAEAENSKSQETPVMEDNVLYEYGGPHSTHAMHIPVMEENVLYESSGGRN